MSFREQLQVYIAQLEQRLRWSTLLRGLAILAGSALVATLGLVAIANALAFSRGSVTAARFGLMLDNVGNMILMASLLVGVNPTDPLTFAVIVAMFVVIAMTASWIPARRASRLDPMAAIREE